MSVSCRGNIHLPHCSRCTAIERLLHSTTATSNSHDTVYVVLTAPFLRIHIATNNTHVHFIALKKSKINILAPSNCFERIRFMMKKVNAQGVKQCTYRIKPDNNFINIMYRITFEMIIL